MTAGRWLTGEDKVPGPAYDRLCAALDECAAHREKATNALRDICAIGVGTTTAREDALEMQRLARAALPFREQRLAKEDE